SRHGKIRLLIPMLAHAHEVEQTLAAVRQAKEMLDDQKVPYDRRIQIGGMIEVPAAALSLKYFISKLDFLSIGTNDLIQYMLAIKQQVLRTRVQEVEGPAARVYRAHDTGRARALLAKLNA